MSRLFAVARYEFIWDFRKYRTIVMLFVLLLATAGYGILQPILLLTPAQRLALGNNWWMKVIGQYLFTRVVIGLLPLMVGGTLATDSISQEFDKGWIVPLLSQPISKAEIYAGKVFEKVIMCCIFSLVVITVSLVASYVVDSPASYLNLLPYIFLSVVVTFFGFAAIALLLSSLIKNSSVVFGSMLGLLVLLIIVYFAVVFYSNGYNPWMNAVPMINESMFPSVIGQYMLNPNGNLPFDASSFGVTKTESISALSIFSSSIISVLVELGLVLSVGFYFFRKRELV